MIAIILVGGLGTRLRPLTLKQPKALLPIANKPFIAHLFKRLQKQGIRHAVMAIGVHNAPYVNAFKSLAPRNLRVSFSIEKTALGTGGAIRLAYEKLLALKIQIKAPVLVLNGDIFFDLDIPKMVRFHKRSKSALTIALTKVNDPAKFGLVELSSTKRIRRFIEKPTFKLRVNYVNAGAYLFERQIFELIPSQKPVSIEKDTFPLALHRGEFIYGFAQNGYWNDIGTVQSYFQTNLDIARMKSQMKANIRLFHPTTKVDSSAKMNGVVILGKGVLIGKNVILKNSIVLENTRIGEGTVIDQTILGPGCDIGRYCELGANIVLGEHSKISDYSKLPQQ